VHVKPIPIYDATAPITCTADNAEIASRLEQIERIHTNLDGIERTDHGVLLHFPHRPDLEADLRKFIVDEKACCQFWGFEITAADDQLLLRWDAPPTLDDYMDQLLAAFKSDQPITAASGLL
jgi:hypothetical protein